MTVFEFDVQPRDAAGSGAIDRVNKALLKAVGKRMETHRITRSEIAKRLDVDKSVVSRWLRGNQNITPRTFGEILWALDFDFEVVLEDLLDGSDNTGSVHIQSVRLSGPDHKVFFQSDDSVRSSGSRRSPARFVPTSTPCTVNHKDKGN